MFLVDTNVWLERLLDRERSAEVGDFLDRVPSECLFITEFCLSLDWPGVEPIKSA